MACIIVTGTPGTGKTEIAKEVAKKLKWKYIDANEVIKKEKLRERYDTERDTYIVNEKKLARELIKLINKNSRVVIDSHLSHFIPKKYVDLCIVTKCKIPELRKRMRKRGYNELKIKENIDAELFDVCLNEAYEFGHDLLAIDTARKKANGIVRRLF